MADRDPAGEEATLPRSSVPGGGERRRIGDPRDRLASSDGPVDSSRRPGRAAENPRDFQGLADAAPDRRHLGVCFMIRKSQGFSPFRLICMGLATSLTVVWLFGCGQAGEATQVEDTGHGAQTSKNMQDFMKTNPYKKIVRERVQTK
jgi:hypothetical protein